MTLVTVVLLYLALGAVAGVLAGLFGIGGGLIIVPGLILSFGWQGVSPDVSAHLAVGTSLATIVFTSLSSIRSHHRHRAVRWDLFRPMAVGIVMGAVVGAWTAAYLSGPALQKIIGVFAITVALRMFLNATPKPGRDTPGAIGLGGAGVGIGWASALFGIGGGTLTVPYLSWCNVRIQAAVGTSAACGLPIAVAGALANVWTGWQNPALPAYSLGFINVPALLGIIATSVLCARVGANLAHRLNARVLKRIFALLLLVLGLRFLMS
ncbi:sulfite exporter TauE/SafE family protein [Marinobacter sp. C2H3]|uniref:sulfite exporter TauE/SafE family protein n=1 Tax=Marinobacter sp. C2H3 TaxID=3119003 RepID=UPI00300ED578